MPIQPYLFFDGRCEEAIGFYQRAIDAQVETMMRFNESPDPVPEGMLPPGSENKIMHASLKIGDGTVMASDGGCSGKTSFNGFSLSYAVPDEAAVQRELRLKRIARLRQQGRGSDAHRLLPMLKDPDAEIRRQAELAIWSVWGRSGNADVDRLFRAGVQQIGREAYDDAIEILSRVVDNKPDFAEAWNKRAAAQARSA